MGDKDLLAGHVGAQNGGDFNRTVGPLVGFQHRDERPAHRVWISPLSVATTPVTQAQWSAVMKSDPSNFKGADLSGFRERGAHSKPFPTRYYSADIHRAALVLPEFVREALGD